MLPFVASILKHATCEVALFINTSVSYEFFESHNVDMKRVSFLRVHEPDTSRSTPGYSSVVKYLESVANSGYYRSVQFSRVESVAFQSDPFLWLSWQPPGLHVFAEEETIVSRPTSCDSQEGKHSFQYMPEVTQGYLIGTVCAVQEVLLRVRDVTVEKCVQTVYQRIAHDGVSCGASHVHFNWDGPVWIGSRRSSEDVVMDSESNLVNVQNRRYAVLFGYHEHDVLARVVTEKVGSSSGTVAMIKNDACSLFNVREGDCKGSDLGHRAVSTIEECCLFCIKEKLCTGFVFSAQRRHCWLSKSKTLNVIEAGALRGNVVGVYAS